MKIYPYKQFMILNNNLITKIQIKIPNKYSKGYRK